MPARKTTILTADDDPQLLRLIKRNLEFEDYHVLTASDGVQALEQVQRNNPDVVLLDVMMPGQSGFDLCRLIRETNDVPILFLSARDTDVDKIRGLGLGGDDYIVKSATPGEVVARVKAVLRRAQRGAVAAPSAVLDFGRLTLDLRAHEVRVEGNVVPFTAREFDVLAYLAEYPRQVFTREHLFERFWGEYGDRHTVTVHIGRIREKIEVDPEHPKHIITVWGVGYRFEGEQR